MLGELPVSGRPTGLDKSRQGPTALAVGAGGTVGHFISLFSVPLSGRRPDID